MRGRGANDGLQWRPRFISTRLHQWRPSRTARPVPKVTIKAGHVRPIWAGHPWVYAQAVDHIEGGATAGDEVDVVDPRGQWLGRGLYSPDSAISVRLFTRTKSQGFTKSLIEQRLIEALVRRKALGWPSSRTNAFRWINGEGDDMPGLIVDRFGETSHPHVYAAGDVARFPDPVFGGYSRVEHWEHAREHGWRVGRNMAGENEPYERLSYFFSRVFGLSLDVVGRPAMASSTVIRGTPGDGPCVALGVFEKRLCGVVLIDASEDIENARSLIEMRAPAGVLQSATARDASLRELVQAAARLDRD